MSSVFDEKHKPLAGAKTARNNQMLCWDKKCIRFKRPIWPTNETLRELSQKWHFQFGWIKYEAVTATKNGPVRKPVDSQEVLQGEDRHPSVVVEVGQGVVELLGPGGQVVGRGLAGVRDRLVLLIGSEIMNQISKYCQLLFQRSMFGSTEPHLLTNGVLFKHILSKTTQLGFQCSTFTSLVDMHLLEGPD